MGWATGASDVTGAGSDPTEGEGADGDSPTGVAAGVAPGAFGAVEGFGASAVAEGFETSTLVNVCGLKLGLGGKAETDGTDGLRSKVPVFEAGTAVAKTVTFASSEAKMRDVYATFIFGCIGKVRC